MVLYFDGLCEPRNPGGVAVGAFVLLDNEGETLLEGGEVVHDGGPLATNNVAEWCALGFGLKAARETVKGKLLIRGDSQLVIRQLNGEWKMKAEHLRPYRARCLALLEGLDWFAEWVPREENEIADAVGRRIYQDYRKSKVAK